MRQLFCIACLILISWTTHAQNEVSLSRETARYRFQINYWFNMHHLLWTEAYFQANLDSTMISQKLNKEEQEALDAAVQYYRDNLIQEDLRAGAYSTPFREWIINQGEQINQTPSQFVPHMKVLFRFDGVYREHFWPEHSQACKRVIRNNLELIRATEEAYVEQISKLTRQAWQSDRIQVDVTYLGKITKRNMRNRPYTNIFPTHVVMNTLGDDEVDGGWLELLYHESAHHLILRSSYFVNGTIQDVAEINKLDAPRQLWHAYLFYLTGKVTQDLLVAQGLEYPQIYMQRNNVFGRYYPHLDEHLSSYRKREVSLAEATLNILRGIAERQ